MYCVYCIPVVLKGSVGEFSIQVFVECSMERFCGQGFQKFLEVERYRGYLVVKGRTWFGSRLRD